MSNSRRRAKRGFWPHWTEEEDRIVDRHASQMTTRCQFFQRLLAGAVADLGEYYRQNPGQMPSNGARTREAIRTRMYMRTQVLGRTLIAARWSPPERRLSKKWASKLVGKEGPLDRMCLKDCARMLLAELYERGIDRTLRACCTEVWKQYRELSAKSRPGPTN
jgi:hypothetical protein